MYIYIYIWAYNSLERRWLTIPMLHFKKLLDVQPQRLPGKTSCRHRPGACHLVSLSNLFFWKAEICPNMIGFVYHQHVIIILHNVFFQRLTISCICSIQIFHFYNTIYSESISILPNLIGKNGMVPFKWGPLKNHPQAHIHLISHGYLWGPWFPLLRERFSSTIFPDGKFPTNLEHQLSPRPSSVPRSLVTWRRCAPWPWKPMQNSAAYGVRHRVPLSRWLGANVKQENMVDDKLKIYISI